MPTGPRWSSDSSRVIYFTPGAQPGDGTIWEMPRWAVWPRRLVSALGPGDLVHDDKRLAFVGFEKVFEVTVVTLLDSSRPPVLKLRANHLQSAVSRR